MKPSEAGIFSLSAGGLPYNFQCPNLQGKLAILILDFRLLTFGVGDMQE
jgi:hypothetical protein